MGELSRDEVLRVRGAAQAATWSGTRFFMLDYENGDDSRVGYSDGAPDASKAVKTAEVMRNIIPLIGNGRFAVLLIKPRTAGATYRNAANTADSDLDFSGHDGYGYFLRRGTLDFSNSVADKINLGAIQGQVGPNGDGSWTVAAAPAPTTSVFSVAAGALTAETGIIGMRVRFTGNITAGLTNVCGLINANTGTAITVGTNLGTAPVAGDTFFIEQPGVRFRRIVDSATNISANSGSTLNNSILATAGLAATATFSFDTFVIGGPNTQIAFCETTAATTNATLSGARGITLALFCRTTYADEVGTSRAVGFGFRAGGVVAPSFIQSLQMLGSSFLSTAASNFSNIASLFMGNGGSYFKTAPAFNFCGLGSGSQPNAAGSTGMVFGSTSASDRYTRIEGGALGVNQSNMRLAKISFSNAPAQAIVARGLGLSLLIDDCINGTVAPVDVGLDITGCFDSRIMAGKLVANTVSGANGNIRMVGPVVQSAGWTDLTRTDLYDAGGNHIQGTGLVFASQGKFMLNGEGGTIPAFSLVRVSASGTVVRAQADTAANASEVVGVIQSAPLAGAGAMVITSGSSLVLFEADPTTFKIAYLSEATSGKARDVPPVVAGTNQKLRVGQIMSALGGGSALGVVAVKPEFAPLVSDGVAP